jgi:hypothetical protein
MHAFSYFQVDGTAPLHNDLPARCDSGPVVIPMFIWMTDII